MSGLSSKEPSCSDRRHHIFFKLAFLRLFWLFFGQCSAFSWKITFFQKANLLLLHHSGACNGQNNEKSTSYIENKSIFHDMIPDFMLPTLKKIIFFFAIRTVTVAPHLKILRSFRYNKKLWQYSYRPISWSDMTIFVQKLLENNDMVVIIKEPPITIVKI